MALWGEDEPVLYAYRWENGTLVREPWRSGFEARRVRLSRRERRTSARTDSKPGRRNAESVGVFGFVRYRRHWIHAGGFRCALYLRPDEKPNYHHFRALDREVGRQSLVDAIRSAPRAPSRSA